MGLTKIRDSMKENDNLINVKDYGLLGNDSNNDATQLNSLITAIGSTNTDLYFPRGTYKIATNVTFPSNIVLHFANGAMLKVANGYSVTGTNTKLECGLWQCFDLSLGGTLAGTWNVKEVYPQWFGAIGDGTTIDKTAFDKMFAFCTLTKIKAYIPKSTYNIGEPLAEIGSYSIDSTENGNFIIEGECEHDTVLSFNFTDDSYVAFKLKENSSGWDISNFRLKKASGGVKGIGFYFDKVYKSTFKNLHTVYFDIGVKKESYITTFTNVTASNCHCGIYDLGGTSTLNISCYGASSTIPGGDVRALAGCGFYISASDYNKYISCASDSNVYAYKVKTAQATYVGSTLDTLEFDNCGCEDCTNAYYIDAKSADISIKRPTIYNITSGLLAHVENASNVYVSDYSDCVTQGISRGSNVGQGVIKMLSGGFNTGGNPSNYPINTNQNAVQCGIKGIRDFNYDGIRFTSDYYYTHGKMLRQANNLELKLYARTNGTTAGITVNVLPMTNYSGGDIDRGGVINIGIYNDSGTVRYSKSCANALIKITLTKIVESTVERGYQILIEPFDSLTNPTLSTAIFDVDAYAAPVGADFQGKDHNIKEIGTYSGRTNILLKGVDY